MSAIEMSVTNNATSTNYKRMLEDIVVSPFKTHTVTRYSHKHQGNRKLQQSKAAFNEKHQSLKMNLVNLLGVDEKEVGSSEDEEDQDITNRHVTWTN